MRSFKRKRAHIDSDNDSSADEASGEVGAEIVAECDAKRPLRPEVNFRQPFALVGRRGTFLKYSNSDQLQFTEHELKKAVSKEPCVFTAVKVLLLKF